MNPKKKIREFVLLEKSTPRKMCYRKKMNESLFYGEKCLFLLLLI